MTTEERIADLRDWIATPGYPTRSSIPDAARRRDVAFLLAELDAARQHNEALATVLAQHNDFGALFQPGGRFYKEANLTLGSSAVRGGGAWLVEQLDAARAERDAAIDENIRLMNAETEALRAQLVAARAEAAKLRKVAKLSPCFHAARHFHCTMVADFPREHWCLRCAALAEGEER